MINERYSRKPGTGTAYPTTNMPQNLDWESAGYGQAQINMKRTRHSLHQVPGQELHTGLSEG